MTYAYEIEDWTTKKIRRKSWDRDSYCYLNEEGRWLYATPEMAHPLSAVDFFFSKDDWELYYGEPHKPPKIALFRYTYKDNDNAIYQTLWTSNSWQSFEGSKNKLLKTETKEVEL